MFTGIVEEIGKVLNITNDTLSFSSSKTVEDALIGSSICAVSYTHPPSPRDLSTSRMPSSA